MKQDNHQKLAFTLEEAAAYSGIGRTSLYMAHNRGLLTFRKCGRRTLILANDLAKFLEELPKAA